MHSLVSFFVRPTARVLLVATMVAIPLAGSAQPRGAGPATSGPTAGGPTAGADPAARMEARLAELTQRLSLTAQQQAQARQIATETRAELDALRLSAQGVSEPRRDPTLRARFRAIHWRAEDRLWAILSCEQKDQLRLLMREKRAQRMDRRMEQGPPGRGRRGGHPGHGQPGGPHAAADIVEDGDEDFFGI